MGVGITPHCEKEFPGSESFSKFTDGKDLVHSMGRLDEICMQNRLTPFSTFAPDYDSLACELSEGEVLEEICFDSADGLKTVSELIKALKSEKQWFKGLALWKKEAEVVGECLQLLQRLLKTAAKKRIRNGKVALPA